MLFKLYFLEVGEKGKYLNRCLICNRQYYSEKHNSIINQFHKLFLSRSRSVSQHLTCAPSGWLLCSLGLIETVLTLNPPKYSTQTAWKTRTECLCYPWNRQQNILLGFVGAWEKSQGIKLGLSLPWPFLSTWVGMLCFGLWADPAASGNTDQKDPPRSRSATVNLWPWFYSMLNIQCPWKVTLLWNSAP